MQMILKLFNNIERYFALFLGVSNLQYVAQGMYNGFNNLPVIAIPCFMLAGLVMETGGLSKRLVNIANQLMGNTTGGLGAVAIVACLFFGAVSYVMSRKAGYKGTGQPFNLKEFLKALWDGIWALLMPVIILGGIYSGVFTPTEAAVVALVYGIFVSMVIYRELSFKKLFAIFDNFVSFSGGIVLTFAPAIALGAIFALLGIPQAITDWLLAVSANKFVALLMINCFLLFVGMLLDAITAIIILAPMLLAVLQPFGIDPVHFGIIMTLNLAVGFVTPPVAANLFVVSGMTDIPIEKIAKVAVLFIITLFVSLILITYMPALSLIFIR
jgi:C4-dicarboxylate transporter DctM subunit